MVYQRRKQEMVKLVKENEMAHKNNNELWRTAEDLKKGTTKENYSSITDCGKGNFAKKMPEEGRSKGTWGAGYSRP